MLDLLSDATTAQAQSVRRFYQPELDGLRFYAFLGVFVCHTLPFDDLFYQRLHLPLPWIWGAAARAGGAGVDLFFALSAYLITSLLLRERQETGDLSLRLFYIRRTLRIWPLYFLVVALGLVFAHTGGEHELAGFTTRGFPGTTCWDTFCLSAIGSTLFLEWRNRSVLHCGPSPSRSSST